MSRKKESIESDKVRKHELEMAKLAHRAKLSYTAMVIGGCVLVVLAAWLPLQALTIAVGYLAGKTTSVGIGISLVTSVTLAGTFLKCLIMQSKIKALESETQRLKEENLALRLAAGQVQVPVAGPALKV